MKVLNYGSLNIDYVYSVNHFVEAGETLDSLKMEVFSGGKGLNQSIALSRSGVQVWHAGAVGEDGEFLLEQLSEAGVHTEFVNCLSGRTGHAIIQRDKEGQNCILLYGGANHQIDREEAERVLSHFESGDMLVLQNEISEMAYIMEMAHEREMQIVLNPSPMNEVLKRYPLEYVNYFLLNEIEAAGICGSGMRNKELLKSLAERFPHAKIVLTLGEQGSLYWDGKAIYEQGIYKVDVKDTTAAGDTFTGYFIGGLVRGEAPEKALDHAARASAIAVSRAGAAPSIPYRKEVEAFGGKTL